MIHGRRLFLPQKTFEKTNNSLFFATPSPYPSPLLSSLFFGFAFLSLLFLENAHICPKNWEKKRRQGRRRRGGEGSIRARRRRRRRKRRRQIFFFRWSIRTEGRTLPKLQNAPKVFSGGERRREGRGGPNSAPEGRKIFVPRGGIRAGRRIWNSGREEGSGWKD